MICPNCNTPGAYIGLKTIECPNHSCEFFDENVIPKAIPAEDEAVTDDNVNLSGYN